MTLQDAMLHAACFHLFRPGLPCHPLISLSFIDSSVWPAVLRPSWYRSGCTREVATV